MSPTRRDVLSAALLSVAASACSRPSVAPSAGPRTTELATASATPAPGAATAPAGTPLAGTPAPTRVVRTRSATEVGSGPRTGSRLSLTFHGAGDDAIARAVLAELARGRVHVTVLAVGTWLADSPAVARAVLDGGHELGNHTQHHLPMRRLSAAAAYAEIRECAQRLTRLAGSPGPWFRASGTQHTTATIRRAAALAGYDRCLSYDLDSLDWTDPGARTIVRTVLAGARPGSIVSLHLGHHGTVTALPEILAGLAARRLHAVPVGTLLA